MTDRVTTAMILCFASGLSLALGSEILSIFAVLAAIGVAA